jgi:hypothetical protein
MTVNRRYSSGRETLIGRSFVHAAPPALEPQAYQGAAVYCSDGALWWSNGITWRKGVDEARAAEIAGDVTANVFRTQLDDLLLTVDPSATPIEGEVYNTINQALEFASLRSGTYRANWSETRPLNVVIRLVSGFVWREQVRNFGLDLARVTIIADDLEVVCESAFLAKAGGGNNTYHPAIGVFGGVGPNTAGFVLVDDGTPPPQDPERVAAFGAYTPRTQGVRVTSGGFFRSSFRSIGLDLLPITPRAGGFRNFDRGVECGTATVNLEASYIDQCREFAVVGFGGKVTLFGVDAGLCSGAQTLRATGGVIEVATTFEGTSGPVPGLYGGNMRRNGLAGADTSGDMWVGTGGTIIVRSALALGGVSQSPNAWTSAGVIFDARNISPPVISGLIAPQSYTVGTLPAAGANTGRMVYVTNGAVGAPILAFSDGTNWLRSDTRTAVSAT